jgi:hypothetical protein
MFLAVLYSVVSLALILSSWLLIASSLSNSLREEFPVLKKVNENKHYLLIPLFFLICLILIINMTVDIKINTSIDNGGANFFPQCGASLLTSVHINLPEESIVSIHDSGKIFRRINAPVKPDNENGIIFSDSLLQKANDSLTADKNPENGF